MNTITNNSNLIPFKSNRNQRSDRNYQTNFMVDYKPDRFDRTQKKEKKGIFKSIVLYVSMMASTTLALKANVDNWWQENVLNGVKHEMVERTSRLEKLEAYSLNQLLNTIQNVAPSTVRIDLENSLGSGVVFFDKNQQEKNKNPCRPKNQVFNIFQMAFFIIRKLPGLAVLVVFNIQ